MSFKPVASFKADLARGAVGQNWFLQRFPGLKQTDGRKGDFTAPDGSKIELKTDSYAMGKTANFFIERFSSIEVGSPGGPWQAVAHGCDWFVYLYASNSTGFIFSCPDLLKQLEAIESTLKPVNVRNVRWTTVGYKVPRALLMPVAIFTADGLQILQPDCNVSSWENAK